jgi:hypothetical protein
MFFLRTPYLVEILQIRDILTDKDKLRESQANTIWLKEVRISGRSLSARGDSYYKGQID